MKRMTYYWKIQTADRRGAGTDARIRLALHGDEADMNQAAGPYVCTGFTS